MLLHPKGRTLLEVSNKLGEISIWYSMSLQEMSKTFKKGADSEQVYRKNSG